MYVIRLPPERLLAGLLFWIATPTGSHTDGNGGLEDLRIKEMAPDQIKQLMSEIEEYLQNLKSYSNINITSLEAFDDYETQYDNLKTLYQKLKKYL